MYTEAYEVQLLPKHKANKHAVVYVISRTKSLFLTQ